jgi:predicted ATPase/DNA-binding XRE family transcriptional regulator
VAGQSFAELLRQHRQSRGLTQAELAERAGLSGRAISDLERGLKQAPRASTVRLLVRGLSLADAEAISLLRAAQPGQHVPPNNRPVLDRCHLPVQLTTFVGRARELAAVNAHLAEHRLVSLTGAGGVGKTRLAFEAAVDIAAGFPDGIWAIELAPLADPAQVSREVAARIGIQVRDNEPALALLRKGLAERELLIVLDNCEHLVAACAELARVLLEACPGVRLMATSRERLGVPGEAVFVVPPLDTPHAREAAHPTELARYDAVHLFVERARLARADFALTEQNAEAVTAICRKLDGIPLAIELASARVRALSVEEIASRLGASPFRLLTGGAQQRQRTLAATLDWSYELLDEAERVLLRGLSVFLGGFELDAVEAVRSGDTVLEELTGLVDKSLVVAERRYRLLEPVRQYAAQKLVESGEVDAVRARHRDWYLAFAERAVDGMIAPDQVAWYARLEAEHDNLRAALEYSWLEPNPEAELRLVGALAVFWARHGTERGAEARARLDDVLPRTEQVSSLAGRRARILALDWRGYLDRGSRGRWISPIEEHGDAAHAQRAVALGREFGDPGLLATALRHLATLDYAMYGLGASPHPSADAHVAKEQAQALLEEAVECAREAGVAREVGYSLAHLAGLAHARGDVAEAERLSTESLTVLRQAGDRDALASGLGIFARIALRHGDRALARRELEEGCALRRELSKTPLVSDATLLGKLDVESGDFAGAVARFREILGSTIDPGLLVFTLVGVAQVAAGWGDAYAAARLLGATVGHSVFRRHSAVSEAVDAMDAASALRSTLGQEMFAAAWAEGESMSLDRAVAYALSLEPPPA